MPPYEVFHAAAPPSNLLPVDFDLGAARAAVAAVQAAADAVERSARARAVDSRAAEADWEGPQRRVYDGQERAADGQASALVTQLRKLAGDIAETADAVRTENQAREAKLEDWRKDQERMREQWISSRRQGAGA